MEKEKIIGITAEYNPLHQGHRHDYLVWSVLARR